MSKELTYVSNEELYNLAAVDNELYCSTFFPKTARQKFAPMHHDVWNKLESNHRLINILMYRGASKTSQCRMYTSKMIAYEVFNTILYVSKSEGHAIKSTSWIKQAVEFNTKWTSVYNIRKGSKWQDTELEIIVGPEEFPIWIMCSGVTGSVRGINRADYRPGLIVLDDVLDDENCATAEQRAKINRLIYGALMESLAPEIDAPNAKMISLNTPQNREDYAVMALKDPSWISAVYGCWTPETAGLPSEYQKSAWEERYPTKKLRQDKKDAVARNMTTTFVREKECRIVSSETVAFKLPWLNKYNTIPEGTLCVYAIDPVPPPSPTEIAKGLHKKNYEAHVVWGAVGDKKLLLDYRLMRGHEPTWSITTFFEMQRKWRPYRTLVESVNYQRVLAYLIRKAMDQERAWYSIEEVTSSKNKYMRIINAHNGLASRGLLYVRDDQTDFIEQFATYPDCEFDDLLDASAMCLDALAGFIVDDNGELTTSEDLTTDYHEIEISACP